jgi:phosphoribosylglycinamide formyltransferase-1
MKRIAVLASGGGSNLQSLLDAQDRGFFDGRIVMVFSNVDGCGALLRAEAGGVERVCLPSRGFVGTREEYDARTLSVLEGAGVDLVCLAGYMRILTPALVRAFRGRMLNIHPALLPKFGGPGFYGHHVHEAVLKAGEKESGATVHFVVEETDAGPILLQGRVPVLPGDTPGTLAARVLEVEHRIYPEAVRWVCADRVRITGERAEIIEP